MKIIQLHAENFKRLGVVEITPEGNVVTIGGKNGQGKSSVLDAILVALKGLDAAPLKPIRKGEERSLIKLDMGDLIVTRTFIAKEDGSFTHNIKLENADGLRYQSPQAVLDALLGEIGFDPFEFVNLKPKDQVTRLLEMVPLTIDLDEYAELDASDYQRRTEANRDVARLRGQLAGIPEEAIPDEAPDRDGLTDQLANAARINTDRGSERRRREYENGRALQFEGDAKDKRDRAAELRRQAEALDQAALAAEGSAKDLRAELEKLDPVPDDLDTDALRQELQQAEALLAVIERQQRRGVIAAELATAEKESQGFTAAMAKRAEERNTALAEAEMPVEGLSLAIGQDGKPSLLWDDLPFDKDQISTAAMLRVSVAVGMAANPRLRVLRISDGSLLDEESLADLGRMAEADDFQIWMEVVGEGQGVGIVMEDGLIRGADQPDPAADKPADEKPKAKAKAKAAPAGSLL